MAKQEIQCVIRCRDERDITFIFPKDLQEKKCYKTFCWSDLIFKIAGFRKKIDIYVRPFCKFSARGYVHDAWWERSGSGGISVSLCRMVRCTESVDGESTKGWEWGETGGIAFMLVVSFGLGNFGRWLVRGAQSGLPDLTWLAEIPRQFPIIRGPDAAAQASGLLLLFRPPSTPSAWFHFTTETRWLSMSSIHYKYIVQANIEGIAILVYIISFFLSLTAY